MIREIALKDYLTPELQKEAELEGLKFYDLDKMTHWGYFKKGELIGFIGLLPLSDTEARFKNSYIKPEYRRRGIGNKLDDYRRKEAKRMGYNKFRAVCTPASIALQLKKGAILTGEDEVGFIIECDL
jgi:GNAT superfamily N-acetyltransferase